MTDDEIRALCKRLNTPVIMYDTAGFRAALSALIEAAVDAERGRWQELAEHLRHCRGCGEEDVARCYSGAALWKAATGNDPKA